MKSVKGHQEEEEEEEDEIGMKKDATPSSSNTKETDGKNNDKASAIRSKHSVTEQRRRSKINERFQILRDLIPNPDQKRDTASFLLEVIQYVQYLQEKVQKYEGSYQPWSSEPTKLMPWRNSHWRMQSLPAQPHVLKNGTGPESTYLGSFDENPATVTSTMQPNQQNPMDQQQELGNKSITTPVPIQAGVPTPVPNNGAFSETQPRPVSDQYPNTIDALNHPEDLAIDGGTINISSPYSQGLLNSLTQALQSAGLDLSEATISVQINFGKRANQGITSGTSVVKDNENPPPAGNQHMDHFREASNDEELEQAQKRMKI
ncbi:transcription factor BIM2-like isoform X1 [Lycium ferocissimum]|uniref:transcription factor BIM2-like isoform X1 n=1 Tax=Lycium ferocissimum TaxID=112874 RepID=UPI002814D2BD|nr:transcription factor BIM2-like isoform X1 [Lycium ferocissimum]